MVVVMVLVGRGGCGLWQEGVDGVSVVPRSAGVVRGGVSWPAGVGGLTSLRVDRWPRWKEVVVIVCAREWRRGWNVVGGTLRTASRRRGASPEGRTQIPLWLG